MFKSVLECQCPETPNTVFLVPVSTFASLAEKLMRYQRRGGGGGEDQSSDKGLGSRKWYASHQGPLSKESRNHPLKKTLRASYFTEDSLEKEESPRE